MKLSAWVCIALLALSVFGITGCGQKGDLYLPQPTEPVAASDTANTTENTDSID